MNTTVLAAVNASPACSPVLGFAKLFASTLGDRVCAVHVIEDHRSEAIGDLALRAGVDLEFVDGDPVREIVRAAHDPEIDLVVVGARDLPNLAGPGHVTREIATRLRRPLLVVPANAVVPTLIKRVLIPLEGNPATTDAIRELLEGLPFGPDTEFVALHAFTPGNMPPFANHAPHETDAWVHEFRRRYVPAGAQPAITVEMRCGSIEQVVPEVAESVNATLTVVSWSQDLAPSHARLVKALLAHNRRPTLLLPAGYRRDDEYPDDRTASSTPVPPEHGRPRGPARNARVRDNRSTFAG